MATRQRVNGVGGRVELGRLLATTVGSVVQAQEQLDAHAQRRAEEMRDAEPGSVVLPPLWYTFAQVDVEIELSAQVQSPPDGAGPVLLAKTLSATSIALYGHAASAGVRVRLQVEPQGVAPIVSPDVRRDARTRTELTHTDDSDG